MTFGDAHGAESRALARLAPSSTLPPRSSLAAKLGKFEDREIDMRLQLEARVATVEKQLQNNRAPPAVSFITSGLLHNVSNYRLLELVFNCRR
jgi:hypothetical protein